MEKSLVEILGNDRAEEVKDAIRDIIISNIKEDLSREYIIESRDLSNFIEEILEEIKQELKAEIKDLIRKDLVEKALKSFNL